MKTQTIQINKKENGKIQYLTEVLPMIPTNTILYKTLTGLGATYGELKTDRNSIIMNRMFLLSLANAMIPNIEGITCLAFMKAFIRMILSNIWRLPQIRE